MLPSSPVSLSARTAGAGGTSSSGLPGAACWVQASFIQVSVLSGSGLKLLYSTPAIHRFLTDSLLKIAVESGLLVPFFIIFVLYYHFLTDKADTFSSREKVPRRVRTFCGGRGEDGE